MPLTDHDEQRLRRAIALAAKGRFAVEPNPPVGCVIERDDAGIVGESWHGAWGAGHAEVSALGLAGPSARDATVYVSLAPCGNAGKTPACADALVAARVARVVYGAADPNPAEAGTGVARLRAAGIAVEAAEGDVRAEAEALLEHFRGALARRRPWTVLKWAMSLDGSIAPRRGASGAISGARAKRLVHDWRAHADAVAVGVETVLTDDPRLTCRLAARPPDDRTQPVRVVFDSQLRTPVGSRLVAGVEEAAVLILTAADADPFRREALEAKGCVVHAVPESEGHIDPLSAVEAIYDHGVRRMLVEGGARIHGALLRAGLADQVSAFVAPHILGGTEAVPAVEGTGIEDMGGAIELEEIVWRRLGNDLLMQGYVPR